MAQPTDQIKLDLIIPNKANGSIIKDDAYAKLMANIKEDAAAIMENQPMLTDTTGEMLGRCKHLEILKELGYTHVPSNWVLEVKDRVKLSKIKNNPNNPRLVKDDKFFQLVQSLEEFGHKMLPLRPIIVDGHVLGGNMRTKALRELGYKEIPSTWVKFIEGFTEAEKKEFVIKDNLGFGEWDFEILKEEWDLKLLEEWGMDMNPFESWGDEEVPPADEEPYDDSKDIQVDVVEGDLIEFVCTDGRVHRLLCGDSTCSDTVGKLIGDNIPDIALCDPPYGISAIEGNTRMKELGWEQYKNDDSIQTAIDAFNLVSSICPKLVFWGANHYANKLPNSSGWLMWDKQDGKDSLTYSMGELAWTNILNNVQIFTHIWDGFRKDSEKNIKRLHPSQKPVKLHKWVLAKTDFKSVLDLFGGSGSVMVATHELDKYCYCMEISPKYCQVIINRMVGVDDTLVVKINGSEYTNELPI